MEINKIYNEDCYTFLPKLLDKSIDLVLVDVPYELEMNGGCSPQSDFANRKLIKDKHLKFIADGFNYDLVFNEFERVCKKINLLIFCSNKQIAKIMTYWESKGCSATLLVWIKPNPIPLANLKHISNIEFIIFVREKGVTFNKLETNLMLKTFKYNTPTNRIHPTEKPIELLSHLLKIHSNKNDVVLDCFSGSGSLANACYKENRNFICCEIDEDFYLSSLKRHNEFSSQKSFNDIFD